MFKSKSFISTLILTLILFSSAFSYSFYSFSIMTGKKTLAINPYVYTSNYNEDFNLSADLIAAYGITNNIDIWANFGSIQLVPRVSYNNWWGMVRYNIKNNNIIALMVNDISASVQYHTIIENEKVFLQGNAIIDLPYETLENPVLKGIVSPGIKIGQTGLDIYCDVIPSYTIGSSESFSLNLVPGIGAALGDKLFSLGFDLGDVTSDASPTISLWFFKSFSFPRYL